MWKIRKNSNNIQLLCHYINPQDIIHQTSEYVIIQKLPDKLKQRKSNIDYTWFELVSN